MVKRRAKVVVTGGAGFIGSNLVDALIKKGFDAHIIDNLSTGKKENVNPKAKFHNLDIRDLEKIKPVFDGARYVFHMAALPRIQTSVADPKATNEINVGGTLNVLLAARDAGVKRLIYSASSSAYGNQKENIMREKTRAKPISPYGLQKYVGEEYCRIFSLIYGLETVSLRYFNVYGPRMSEKGSYLPVFSVFLKQKKEGRPMEIWGDGEQTRSFTHVRDVVRADILAMKSKLVGQGEVINVCASRAYSINKIAEFMGGESKHLPQPKGEIRHSRGDASLAKKMLGWKSQIKLEEGIEEINKVFRVKL